jgi:AcrR family transcriptional regulator
MAGTGRDGRSTRWDPHRRERRQHIIKAAVAAIEQHGPDAVTGQIAEVAGVPRTHVYRHFAGRAALDLAVSRELARSLAESFSPGTARRGSTREVVTGLIDPFLAWIEANPNLYRFLAQHAFALREQGESKASDAKTVLAQELTPLVTGYVAALGAAHAPLGRTVAGLVGLVDSSAVWWLENGAPSRAELTATLTDEVLLILRRTARELGVDLDPDAPPLELSADPRRA